MSCGEYRFGLCLFSTLNGGHCLYLGILFIHSLEGFHFLQTVVIVCTWAYFLFTLGRGFTFFKSTELCQRNLTNSQEDNFHDSKVKSFAWGKKNEKMFSFCLFSLIKTFLLLFSIVPNTKVFCFVLI
uniref:Transmembrane protein n=1 Tax=Cacopsylla melanoneura TaxID=428564 RepID=A0A8D9FE32_9HEMI